MSIEAIKLGDRVRDAITGFEGVVIGRVAYLTGCNQSLVIPRVKDDGSKMEGCWLDDDRLEVIESNAVQLPGKIDPTRASSQTPGGDALPPTRD